MPAACRRALLLLLAAAPLHAAHAQSHDGMTMPAAPPAASSDMMRTMDAMNQAMAHAPMTGDVDTDFLAMMIPHHQGAIDMAQLELQRGKDPAIRRLAQQIIAAQQREITRMRTWLAARRRAAN